MKYVRTRDGYELIVTRDPYVVVTEEPQYVSDADAATYAALGAAVGVTVIVTATPTGPPVDPGEPTSDDWVTATRGWVRANYAEGGGGLTEDEVDARAAAIVASEAPSLRDRSTHTGTQDQGTVAGLVEDLEGLVEELAGRVPLVNPTTGEVASAVEERVRLLAALLCPPQIRYTGGAWPPRSVPTGYAGPVLWDSALDASAPQPPASVDGDQWAQKVT